MAMKSWVITGGICSGKSTLVNWLAEKVPLAVTFSSDHAVSEMMLADEVKAALAGCFGSEVEDQHGINRKWLREVVLPDVMRRRQLEAILHPYVFRALEKKREAARCTRANLFLAEVPLHYEIGATVSADLVIVVASSRSVQVRRMMETRGLDEQIVHKFLEAQWPIEAKVERADVVIWNDGAQASLENQMLMLASPLLHA